MNRWVVGVLVLSIVCCGGGGGGSGSPTAAKLRYVQFEGTFQRLDDATPFDLHVLCDEESVAGPLTCENGICENGGRTDFVPAGQHKMVWKILDHASPANYRVIGDILILAGDGAIDEVIPISEEQRLTAGDSIEKVFSF